MHCSGRPSDSRCLMHLQVACCTLSPRPCILAEQALPAFPRGGGQLLSIVSRPMLCTCPLSQTQVWDTLSVQRDCHIRHNGMHDFHPIIEPMSHSKTRALTLTRFYLRYHILLPVSSLLYGVQSGGGPCRSAISGNIHSDHRLTASAESIPSNLACNT